jgi:hypothetical protein
MMANAQMGNAANTLCEVLCAWVHGNDTSARTLDGGEVARFIREHGGKE